MDNFTNCDINKNVQVGGSGTRMTVTNAAKAQLHLNCARVLYLLWTTPISCNIKVFTKLMNCSLSRLCHVMQSTDTFIETLCLELVDSLKCFGFVCS